MVYGSILMRFTAFFFIRHCPFRCTKEFSFLLVGGATIFAKLRSKFANSPEIGSKVCAQLHTDRWEISKKYHHSTSEPGT